MTLSRIIYLIFAIFFSTDLLLEASQMLIQDLRMLILLDSGRIDAIMGYDKGGYSICVFLIMNGVSDGSKL